ncbi:MAG: DUF1007 family protein [Spirochaetales bacterium]|nr:DUF1007 family protein [Spirochaetales bacterium]
MRTPRLILACVGFLCAFAEDAPAHPHVFIENSFTFMFGGGRLKGIAVTWIFDEMFSASIIVDNDRNRNGKFEARESKAIEEGAFSNLKNFNYFLFIDAGRGRLKIQAVRDFHPEILGKRLVYRFFVPFDVDAGAAGKTLAAGCFDSTYFCDVTYAAIDPVTVEADELTSVSWDLVKDKKNAYWGGTIVPRVVRLKFRLKNE